MFVIFSLNMLINVVLIKKTCIRSGTIPGPGLYRLVLLLSLLCWHQVSEDGGKYVWKLYSLG